MTPDKHPRSLLQDILFRLSRGATLSEREAASAFEIVMSGGATSAQIGALLMALSARGETVEEITAAVRVLRAKALSIEAPPNAIDTCGTGGDAAGTYSISTATALVVAACGVPVAKHGNKAQSSRTGAGSADVLAALGVKIDADTRLVQQSLWHNNIGFLMAPRHHDAMRHVGPARAELGFRTLFNLLGPLANPAGTRRQLVGVFAETWVAPLADVLGRLGALRAWVVHGTDGLDELTTTGPSHVAEWHQGAVTRFTVTPEQAGLPRAHAADLTGGDARHNAAALRRLLDGQPGAYHDIVVLNAAAALIVADQVTTLRDGAVRAAQAIADGSARATLAALIETSNREAVA